MTKLKNLTQSHIFVILFFVLFCFIGLFPDYIAALSAFPLTAFALYLIIKHKSVKFSLSPAPIAVLIMVIAYALSIIWAVDSGMAAIGFVKFVPIILFVFCLIQLPDSAALIHGVFPYFITAMAIISAIGMQIPLFTDFFSVAGRLSGFLQYPNTFALLLLIGELLLVTKQKLNVLDKVCIPLSILGLFYTGSRTVFVLAILANLVCIFIGKNKKLKILVPSGLVLTAVIIAIVSVCVGGLGVFSRFLTISLDSSTFLGRFLYWKDALPLILRHPFGLGYSGYYYIQQSIQTGVYSVMFAHNGFIQLLLDIGWIPAIAVYYSFIRPIFSKSTPAHKKLILAVTVLHTLYDFDLQFIALFMLILTFTSTDDAREISLSSFTVATVSVSLALICGYFGVAEALYTFGAKDACHSLYPLHTKNRITRLLAADTVAEMDSEATAILKQNKYVTVALSAKARCSYSKGDFAKVMQYKDELIRLAPFATAEYKDYCSMLITGIDLYTKAGDNKSAKICQQKLIEVYEDLMSVPEKLSVLGSKIEDLPDTELEPDVIDYITKLKEKSNV